MKIQEYEIRALMIDPHNLDIVRGELEHLILSGCSISYGYYTDTRMSAKISTLGSNYIPGSWIRILAKTDDQELELGTFVVDGKPEITYKDGEAEYSYSLQSVLWALSEDFCLWHYSIGAGAYALDAFKHICKIVDKSNLKLPGAKNYRYSAAKVYEVGESFLSMLHDLCRTSGNRLDVDGHGRITIAPYFLPGQISSKYTIDSDDPETMLLAGTISRSVSNDSVPGRALVIYTSGENEIAAYAQQLPTSEYSSDFRGYMITKKYNVSDLAPATYARAQELAKSYLDQAAETVQVKCSALYFPCSPGECIDLVLFGEKRKYMIQSIDPLNLETMIMGLTLKEVKNGSI